MNDSEVIIKACRSALLLTMATTRSKVTSIQLNYLLEIRRHIEEQRSLVEIAKELRITPAAMTGVADRLQRAGLIVRKRSVPNDRRRIHLGITKQGIVVCDTFKDNLRMELTGSTSLS